MRASFIYESCTSTFDGKHQPSDMDAIPILLINNDIYVGTPEEFCHSEIMQRVFGEDSDYDTISADYFVIARVWTDSNIISIYTIDGSTNFPGESYEKYSDILERISAALKSQRRIEILPEDFVIEQDYDDLECYVSLDDLYRRDEESKMAESFDYGNLIDLIVESICNLVPFSSKTRKLDR